jgi:ketosteroid isomerase-like protein
VYATASGEIFSGRAKIRDYYSKTIPGLGDNFTRESTTDEVHVAGTTAWALGHGRTVIRTQEGVADLKDHWVAIYETVGGEWKVRALSLGENVALMPAKY